MIEACYIRINCIYVELTVICVAAIRPTDPDRRVGSWGKEGLITIDVFNQLFLTYTGMFKNKILACFLSSSRRCFICFKNGGLPADLLFNQLVYLPT